MKTMLVIDDFPSQRELLEEVFIRLGFTVDTADDLESGLNKLRVNQYDVVFTDWSLGGSGESKINSAPIIREADDRGIRTIVHTGTVDEAGNLQRLLEERTNVTKLEKPATLDAYRKSVER